MPTDRRLAAIMFTDIVGYTALMGSDEDKAFEVLRKNRKIHVKFIDQFKGVLIKEIGDGMLAQFNSAVDSVHCAIKIQQQARKELDAQVRIGIHLGDITEENNDVFGDGVNIASRLQSIAEPGGIYISDSVHNAIRSIKDLKSQYLGEVKLKNVNYPFKTYYIKGKGLSVPSKNRIDKLTGTKKTKSVVVLPFDNYTGSEDLEYFVAGMHVSLIGSISKIGGMRVISKTTANAFKNTIKSIPEIASELEVDTVIEASILGLGESVSLQVKLVDAFPEEKQLWMQDYKVEKKQILNLYNTVTKEIAKEIGIMLTPKEDRLLAKSRTVDRDAYDSYLKAQSYSEDFSRESLYYGLDYLNGAIEKEPDWAPLYAGLAKVWVGILQAGIEPPSVASPKIYVNLNKALELDPNLSDAHALSGAIAHWIEWDWEKSEREFLKALAINPNDANSRVLYGQLLCALQKPDEGLAQGRLAYELDPLNHLILVSYGGILWKSDCKKALALAEEITADVPGQLFANHLISMSALQCKEYDKVIKAEKYKLQYQVTEEQLKEIQRIFKEQGIVKAYEIILKYLEDFAVNNSVSPIDMAGKYMIVNQPDKAMDWLEKGFEMHHTGMPFIASLFNFDPLFDNPRFLNIVEKMNLPLP